MVLGRHSYSAGHFQLTIDGDDKDPGYLRSVSGGMIKGGVLGEQIGPQYAAFKHLGGTEVEPISFEIGMSEAAPVVKWIRSSWQRDFSRRNGAIIHADADYNPKVEHQFFDALITETKFPTLDGSAREPAYLSVTMQPERVEMKEARSSGQLRANTGSPQKRWLPSSFELYVDDFDCRMTNKIDSFSFKQTIRPLHCGNNRLPEYEPCSIEFSNLTFYMAAEHAHPFLEWHRAFVMKGEKDTASEREGAIEFLSPDRQVVLFTVLLKRVGICNFSIDRSEANSDQIKRAKIELYVEGMDIAPSQRREGTAADRQRNRKIPKTG